MGVDFLDLDQLRRRGVTLTNGAGVNANAVAEYAVMAVLVAAKRFDAEFDAGDIDTVAERDDCRAAIDGALGRPASFTLKRNPQNTAFD